MKKTVSLYLTLHPKGGGPSQFFSMTHTVDEKDVADILGGFSENEVSLKGFFSSSILEKKAVALTFGDTVFNASEYSAMTFASHVWPKSEE